jgi:hypothetical protein
MRLFSYVFHGLLALFLIAISGLALFSGSLSLHLDMLPWSGAALLYAVFFGSLCGLIALLLALAGRLRALFFVWALVVAGLLVKGFVFSNYHFAAGGVKSALALLAASLIALPGAWFQWRPTEREKRLRRY